MLLLKKSRYIVWAWHVWKSLNSDCTAAYCCFYEVVKLTAFPVLNRMTTNWQLIIISSIRTHAEGLAEDIGIPRAWECELGDWWDHTPLLPGTNPYFDATDLLLRLRAFNVSWHCCEKKIIRCAATRLPTRDMTFFKNLTLPLYSISLDSTQRRVVVFSSKWQIMQSLVPETHVLSSSPMWVWAFYLNILTLKN